MLLLFFQYKNTKRTENESLHRKTEREREVDASLRVRERANSLSLSFKSSLFASARERARRFLLSFLFPQQRRELIFSFFVEGAEELFWRQFFLLLSLSLSRVKKFHCVRTISSLSVCVLNKKPPLYRTHSRLKTSRTFTTRIHISKQKWPR